MRLVQKKGVPKHEDGLVAAFLPRSMRLVMRSAPLPFNGRRRVGLHASPGTFGWDGRAKAILADTGYDADDVVKAAEFRGAEGAMASKSNRKNPRHFDKVLYRKRNFIKRVFNQLKNFRHVATRYDTTASACLAFVMVAGICLWLKQYIDMP